MEGTPKPAAVLAEAVATLEAELAQAADVLLKADLLVLERRLQPVLPLPCSQVGGVAGAAYRTQRHRQSLCYHHSGTPGGAGDP